MTGLTHVHAPDGVAPGSGYSHVVWGTGRFVAVSGQCAFDGDGRPAGAPGSPKPKPRPRPTPTPRARRTRS